MAHGSSSVRKSWLGLLIAVGIAVAPACRKDGPQLPVDGPASERTGGARGTGGRGGAGGVSATGGVVGSGGSEPDGAVAAVDAPEAGSEVAPAEVASEVPAAEVASDATPAGPVTCGSADEYKSLKLSCPAGQVITAVDYASYGDPTGACPTLANGACHSAASTAVVASACIGLPACEIYSENRLFGDPCTNVPLKKVAARVTCGAPAAVPAVNRCSQADERTAIDLACPPGQLIREIRFASYGNPNGSCGSYVRGNCHSPRSMDAISNACRNRNACRVTARDSGFTDPCPAINPKRLFVEVVCAK